MGNGKKKLAIFSLTSCEGCQFEMLNSYEQFSKLTNYFDIANFRLGQENNIIEKFDIAIVEGNPDGEKQKKFLREIRRSSQLVIALGACADLGGIQSERNRLPKNIIDSIKTQTVANIIRVDYTIPGCPIRHTELYECLMDIYWGKIFRLPDLAVCVECRQNGNKCLLKERKPCLGPITRAGCDSICINNGEACLGCRGTKPYANTEKLRHILGTFMTEKEVGNILTIYGENS